MKRKKITTSDNIFEQNWNRWINNGTLQASKHYVTKFVLKHTKSNNIKLNFTKRTNRTCTKEIIQSVHQTDLSSLMKSFCSQVKQNEKQLLNVIPSAAYG